MRRFAHMFRQLLNLRTTLVNYTFGFSIRLILAENTFAFQVKASRNKKALSCFSECTLEGW